MFKAAIIQLNSQQNTAQNLETALRQIETAASNGAEIVMLPENFLYIGPDKTVSFTFKSSEIISLREIARRCAIYLLIGSFPEKIANSAKIHNTSLLIDRSGEIAATYRKMHLFDVDLGESVEFHESRYVEPGTGPAVVTTELGSFGLSICYDLRFPEYYRHLTLSGAKFIFIPSNFALITGKDHWMPLLQARAIENGAYIFAPNQTGKKYDGNMSYGRSVIIDPWGIPVVQASDSAPLILYADIDENLVARVRQTIPSLRHIKIYNLPK